MELTPEDVARWPAETLVLVDRFLEAGAVREVTPGEAEWVISDASKWVGDYHLFFGLAAYTYGQWARSSIDPRSVLTHEMLRGALLQLQHPNCPFRDIDSWSGHQRDIPMRTWWDRSRFEPEAVMVTRAEGRGSVTIGNVRYGKTALTTLAQAARNGRVPVHVANARHRLDGRRGGR